MWASADDRIQIRVPGRLGERYLQLTAPEPDEIEQRVELASLLGPRAL